MDGKEKCILHKIHIDVKKIDSIFLHAVHVPYKKHMKQIKFCKFSLSLTF